MKRTLALLIMVVMGVAMLGGSAVAQYPPSPSPSPSPPGQSQPPDIAVSTPGATITITGRGWGRTTRVTIERKRGGNTENSPVVTTAAGPDGSFALTLASTPEDLEPGAGFIVTGEDATGQQRSVERSVGQADASVAQVAGVSGTDAEVTGTDRSLAASGGPFTVGTLIMIVLLVLGATLLVVTRRRSTS